MLRSLFLSREFFSVLFKNGSCEIREDIIYPVAGIVMVELLGEEIRRSFSFDIEDPEIADHGRTPAIQVESAVELGIAGIGKQTCFVYDHAAVIRFEKIELYIFD